jgi:threonine dehydrogenase-like Zn-dependent dehydrogenase
MKTMQALLALRPGVLGLGELPIPAPGAFEALVRMEACAICNSTDHKLLINEFFTGVFPTVLGHEVVGTVVETGPKTANFKPGDRVFRQRLADQHVPGGRSTWGGFAEYGIVVDEWAKQGLPYDPALLPHDQQKLLLNIEAPLATTMITLMETLDCITTCGAAPGKSVAIVGSGPVGQAFAMFAKLQGAGPVYAFGRRASLSQRFADVTHCDDYIVHAANDRGVQHIIAQGGFDIVMEAVGSVDAMQQCLDLAGKKGKVFAYGIPPDSHPYRPEQLAHPNVQNVGAKEGRVQARLVEYVNAGKVKLQQWMDVCLPLTEYQRGFNLVTQKQANKVVLAPAK